MNKKTLLEFKKKLLTLGFFTGIAMTAGCEYEATNDYGKIYRYISQYKGHENVDETSNIENYYKFVVRNDEAVKLYDSNYIYLFIDKETYEIGEYIFRGDINNAEGRYTEAELYDLPTGKMIYWNQSYEKISNRYYFEDLIKSSYQIPLSKVSDYIEGYEVNSYYSLEELRELEPQFIKCFKIIEDAKVKQR